MGILQKPTILKKISDIETSLGDIPNQTYITEKAKTVDVNASLALKANQSALDTEKARIDNLVQTSSGSFYEECTSGDTGALLVVSSGATTGQINLASVTPVATGYTPVVSDYVRLVYGLASGSAELIDSRGTKNTLGARLNVISEQIELGDSMEYMKSVDLTFGSDKVQIQSNGDLKQVGVTDYLYNMCTIDCKDIKFTYCNETWIVLGGTENKYIAIRVNNTGILSIAEINNKTTVTTIRSQTAWSGSATIIEVKVNGYIYDFYADGTKVYSLDTENDTLFSSTYSYIKTQLKLGFILLQSKGEVVFAESVYINRKILIGSVVSEINDDIADIDNQITLDKELQYPLLTDIVLGSEKITLSDTGLLTQITVNDYLYSSCMLTDTDYIKFNKTSSDFWVILGGTENKYIAININNGSIKNIIEVANKTTITTIRSQTAWSGSGTVYEIRLANSVYDFYVDGTKVYSLDIVNDSLFSSTYSYIKTQLKLGFILLQTRGTNYVIVDNLQFNKLITISEKVGQLSEFFHSIYKGKYISIIGDSMSTYTGYVPSGNAVYYTGSNCGVSSVSDTWWMKLLTALEMNLLINNSWSGSYVSTVGGDTSAGCMTRCQNLHTAEHNPDVIIVYMGINDFMNEVTIGDYNGSQSYPTVTTTFREAYAIMLGKILTAYPQAEVWCATLQPIERNGSLGFPEANDNGVLLETWNNAIRDIASLFSLKVLEHGKCGLTYYNRSIYTGDYGSAGYEKSLHPNALGMSLIANNDIRQMDNAVRTRY